MPTVATTAPGTPAIKCPSRATNITLGPGAACAMANNSLNWRSVSHPAISTVRRCISGTAVLAPPTANKDRVANWRNSATSVAGSFFIGTPPCDSDARRHQHEEHQRKVQLQQADARKCCERQRVGGADAAPDQRLGDLHRGRNDHSGGRSGKTRKD